MKHPTDSMLREDRLPHIWCPGCGLGIVMRCYIDAVLKSGVPLERHVCVSGIGCTSRIPGYLNMDTYHTTHGRALPFATGMKVANDNLLVSVIAGDGDLFNIGGNHLIHAARRNMDLNVICVNNFNYGMTGGQFSATTPMGRVTATTRKGNIEEPFNIPYVVSSLGASFVSRWTVLHVRQLSNAIERMMEMKGFNFLEVISPCPPNFGRNNNFPDALGMLEYFRKNCVEDDDADLGTAGISFSGEKIIVGNFVDSEKTPYHERERSLFARR